MILFDSNPYIFVFLVLVFVVFCFVFCFVLFCFLILCSFPIMHTFNKGGGSG